MLEPDSNVFMLLSFSVGVAKMSCQRVVKLCSRYGDKGLSILLFQVFNLPTNVIRPYSEVISRREYMFVIQYRHLILPRQ